MQRPIDHAVFAGRDLGALEETFSAAGFETSYGGTHSNGVTHMHLVGFGNRSYIELISKNDLSKYAPWWNDQIDADTGTTAWSISVDDIESESQRLTIEGLAVEGPTGYARSRPDGTDVKWDLSFLGDRPRGSPLPMLEMDHTPLEWRVDITIDPASAGLSGLTDVVIGTDDLESTVGRYQSLYPGTDVEDRREVGFGARVASIEDTPVTVAEPLDTDSWLADRVAAHESLLPCAFLIEATDPNAVQDQFDIGEQTPWGETTVSWFDIDVGGRLGAVDRS